MKNSFRWMNEGSWSWLQNAFCFSFLRGGGNAKSTLGKLGAINPTAPMSIEEVIQSSPFDSDQIIAAVDLCDWVFAWSSRDTGIGRRRPLGNMEAVTVHLSINSDITFTHRASDSVLADFDPRFPPIAGNLYTERFARLLESEDFTRGAAEPELFALALADEITGAHVSPEIMNGNFIWAQII